MRKESEEIFDIKWLWTSLNNEQVRLLPNTSKEKSTESNRAFVRSFFCMVESLSYRIRQLLLLRHNANKISLNWKEVFVLSEISIDIEQNGRLSEKQKFYKFESLFKYTFQKFCTCSNKEEIFKKYFSDNRYSIDFKKSIQIRNRITHPKSVNDTYVNGRDFQHIDKASEWFFELMKETFNDELS